MRRGLAPEDLGDLLSSRFSCTLATHRQSGEVLLSPVWFAWRDGAFELVIGRDDVKSRHLRRDPRATVVVYENDPPYRGLELKGRAELLDDGVVDLRRELFTRYMGKDPGYEEALIRVRISGDVRAWDYADDPVFAEYPS